MNIILKNGSGEIEEKKSRFICHIFKIKSEEEAEEYITAVKKKYWDARHNCYAYVTGDKGQIQRFSDDGEPQGTAGKPMLDILNSYGLTDCLLVVTRYFGGVLLGTGGLVRAYSGSVQAGLSASKIITKLHGYKLRIQTDYTGLGKIQYILGQRGLSVLDSVYTDQVELTALIPAEELKTVRNEITEGTNGKAVMEIEEECYFAEIDGEMKTFKD